MTIQQEIILANEIVLKAFDGKKDKGGKPYLDHIAFVQGKMQLYSEMVVATLHDLVEDCQEWSLDRLRSVGFSEQTVEAVEAITKRPNEQYQDYILRVAANPIAKNVKIADLEHNMQVHRLAELTDKDVARLKKYHSAYKFLTQ